MGRSTLAQQSSITTSHHVSQIQGEEVTLTYINIHVVVWSEWYGGRLVVYCSVRLGSLPVTSAAVTAVINNNITSPLTDTGGGGNINIYKHTCGGVE